MNKETYRNELIARITNYINDKEIDSRLVASSYADLIIRYVPASAEDVLSALDQVIESKNSDFEKQRSLGKRYLALPIGNSNIQVRCYFQEKFPSLKFRVIGEKSSFLGLKKERNGSNIIVSAGYDDRKIHDSVSNFEINDETYVFNANGTLFSKNQRCVTPSTADGFNVDVSKLVPESELDAKRLDVINFLYYCMVKNHANVNVNLTIESLDVLYNDVFKHVAQMASMEDELDFYELIRAAGQLIYFKSELGNTSQSLQENGEDYTTFATNSGKRVQLRHNNAGLDPVDVFGESNENNFYDVIVCDDDGNPKVKYMFMQTPHGFSIFRNYLGAIDDETRRSFTIALSNNQFRMAYCLTSKLLPEVVDLKFSDDGSIDYEFQEVRALESASKQNVQTLDLAKIISKQSDSPIKI